MKRLTEDNVERVTNSIVRWLYNRAKEGGLKSFVVGVSGGLDSAVVLALAKMVADQIKGFKAIGLSLPIVQKEEEKIRAVEVGKKFATHFVEIDLTDTWCDLTSDILIELSTDPIAKGLRMIDILVGFKAKSITEAHRIRMGNTKARLRMMTLYDTAWVNKGCVLSTDNFSELMCGFWTLHGDVGDLGPIQSLYKGDEIPILAKHLGIPESIINAVPTDGLGITDSDLDQLGAESYIEVDESIVAYLNNEEVPNKRVLEWIEKTHHKRRNPDNITRQDLDLV